MLQRLTDFMTNNPEVTGYVKAAGRVSLIAAAVMILVLTCILVTFHKKLVQKGLTLTICHIIKTMIPVTSGFAVLYLAVWPEELLSGTRENITFIAVVEFFSILSILFLAAAVLNEDYVL